MVGTQGAASLSNRSDRVKQFDHVWPPLRYLKKKTVKFSHNMFTPQSQSFDLPRCWAQFQPKRAWTERRQWPRPSWPSKPLPQDQSSPVHVIAKVNLHVVCWNTQLASTFYWSFLYGAILDGFSAHNVTVRYSFCYMISMSKHYTGWVVVHVLPYLWIAMDSSAVHHYLGTCHSRPPQTSNHPTEAATQIHMTPAQWKVGCSLTAVMTCPDYVHGDN